MVDAGSRAADVARRRRQADGPRYRAGTAGRRWKL